MSSKDWPSNKWDEAKALQENVNDGFKGQDAVFSEAPELPLIETQLANGAEVPGKAESLVSEKGAELGNLANVSDAELDQIAIQQLGNAAQVGGLLGQVAGTSIPGLSGISAASAAAQALQSGDVLGAVTGATGLGQALGGGQVMAAVGAAATLASGLMSHSSGATASSAAASATAQSPELASNIVAKASVPEELPLKPPLQVPPQPELPSRPGMPPSESTQLSQRPTFDDKNRLFRLYSTLPEEQRLFLDTVIGSEALNEPFAFKLTLASLNAQIELKEVLSKPLTVGIVQSDGSERYLNGYVTTFAFEAANGGWTSYGAQLMSWLHFLSLRVNCRIYQDISIPEIIERVFNDYGVAADYEFRLYGSYEPQDYIVQYQETDENFVSRLMEKEGFTYFFEHRQDGHRLVITDDTTLPNFCPPLQLYSEIEYNATPDRVGEKHNVQSLRAERQLQPARVTLNTFDYQNPLGNRGVEIPTIAMQGDVPRIEVFDGTPSFAYTTAAEGERYARLRMEAFEARTKYFGGESDCPDLTIGRTTKITKHEWFEADQANLLITRVTHNGQNNLDLGREHGDKKTQTGHYRNRFECQRSTVPFRPECVHVKPVIPGLQTATVTAPAGEEIWTNKHGCVKVHFHWDRLGKYDQSSSCWIRVAQAWAGQGWGTVAIPRAGQEVVIGFQDGNPDRPLILGSVFNSVQKPPYELPGGNHMMGFKSNSTGRNSGHSEMVIHDQGGNERINIRSQKDMETTVLHNKTTTVHGPEHKVDVTEGKQKTTVKQDIEMESQEGHVVIKARESLKLQVGENMIVIDKDGTIAINGKNIFSTAKEDHVVRGAKLHLNPK